MGVVIRDMAVSAPAHTPDVRIEDVSPDAFSHRDADDAFLYHVTSSDRVKKILKGGLTPGAKATIQGGAYQAYSRGKTFLTERSGVDFWKDRIEQHLAHAHDDPPDVAVIRVPRALVHNLQPDDLGTNDSHHQAYFTESPVPASLRDHVIAFHGTRVMPEFTSFSCDGPPSDDDGEAISSGSGPDVTAFMGAHFAKEESVARKFANGEGWMKTRFDGETTRPRVLQCALDLKKPLKIRSEDNLRGLAYMHPINDESVLEPAVRRFSPRHETSEEDASDQWLKEYDENPEVRLEANRWLLEQHRPGEGEEEGLATAARELAQAAVEEIKRRGFDGIIYPNQVEGGTAYVVFEPEQARIIGVEYLGAKERPKLNEEALTGKLISGLAVLNPPAPAAPAKPSKFSPEQKKALSDIVSRTDRFKPWVYELYGDRDEAAPWLADEEEKHVLARDFLDEMHQIRVDEKGIVSFESLTDKARRLVGDLPVRLYHHTSTAVTEKVRREGLRPQPGANVNCLGSGSGDVCVFLTAEAGGAAPDTYLGCAVRKLGGEPETLSVIMHLDELTPDWDDEDLHSGRYQFTASFVAPERIENFAKEQRKGIALAAAGPEF